MKKGLLKKITFFTEHIRAIASADLNAHVYS